MNPIRSECHSARIYTALADGVLVGVCAGCGKAVCRQNKNTGSLEWLDGKPPWTDDQLRQMIVGR